MSGSQTWTIDARAVVQRAMAMDREEAWLPGDTEPTQFDIDKWRLETRTVTIGRDEEEAPVTGSDGKPVNANRLWRVRNCWVCPPFIWSSYNSPVERATRAPLTFNAIVPKTLLQIVGLLIFAWQLAMTIYMGVTGVYDLSMYTFWNYTFMTVFSAFFAASLFYERFLLTFTLLFLFPPLFASVAVVRFGIVVIVGRNADVFLGDGSQSIETRYVGDFVVHSLPLGMLLVALLAGLLLYIRRAVGYQLGIFRTWLGTALYAAYYMFSGLFLLAIYTACFSIAKTYPTGIPTGLLWLALIGVNILWMGFFGLIFVAWNMFSIRLSWPLIVKDTKRGAEAAEKRAKEEPAPSKPFTAASSGAPR